MMDYSERAARKQNTRNLEAITDACIDAGVHGTGWLKVDEFGNLSRIDPTLITIYVNPEPEND